MTTIKLPAQVALLQDDAMRGALERAWEELAKLEDKLITCEARLATAEGQLAQIPQLNKRIRQVNAQVQRRAVVEVVEVEVPVAP